MSDIVERMRDNSRRTSYRPGVDDLMMEAADEIERLRGLLRDVLDALGDPVHDLGTDLLDILLRDLGPEFCDTMRWYQTSAAYENARVREKERVTDQPSGSG